jgi:tight adherence protein B
MTLTVSLFILLAVVMFAVVMFFTRRSAVDRVIERRLAGAQVAASEDTRTADGATDFFKQTNLSEIKWLHELLERSSAARKISLLLTQAESSWSVSTVLFVSAMFGLMGSLMVRFWIADIVPVLVAGVVTATFPLLALRVKRDRRMLRFNQKLPDALDLIARALRAGHSISAAIEIVAEEGTEPLRSEFAEVYKQQNFGLPYREALLQLGRRVPSADLQVVITAMMVQKETGGNLVDILDRTTAVLRDRLRIQGEIRIHTAQGRLTGWILCLLPIVMFFLISVTNPKYTRVFLHDPTGRKLAYVGLGMMALGALLIRKIVKIRV